MSSLLLRVIKVSGWVALILALFVVNMVLLWNFSFIRRKVRIENASSTPVFQVVLMESGKPQLFLFKEELDDYLKTHSNYSFLLPAGQDQLLQDQIVASYNAKFGVHGGKGYPTFKRETIDFNHQYIEVYMHGDPHDDVFWYEATDKTLEPKYYMVFGAFHLLLMAALAIGMAAIECWLIMGFFQRRTVRSIGGAT
jgi:hypothetical protein